MDLRYKGPGAIIAAILAIALACEPKKAFKTTKIAKNYKKETRFDSLLLNCHLHMSSQWLHHLKNSFEATCTIVHKVKFYQTFTVEGAAEKPKEKSTAKVKDCSNVNETKPEFP